MRALDALLGALIFAAGTCFGLWLGQKPAAAPAVAVELRKDARTGNVEVWRYGALSATWQPGDGPPYQVLSDVWHDIRLLYIPDGSASDGPH
jgi:hypothetical protein